MGCEGVGWGGVGHIGVGWVWSCRDGLGWLYRVGWIIQG